jgi:(2Fe-2S) ferredoxin
MKKRVRELRIEETRVNAAGCLDRCELGPCIVIYPEGVWYSVKTKEDVDEVLRDHVMGGKVVERLTI